MRLSFLAVSDSEDPESRARHFLSITQLSFGDDDSSRAAYPVAVRTDFCEIAHNVTPPIERQSRPAITFVVFSSYIAISPVELDSLNLRLDLGRPGVGVARSGQASETADRPAEHQVSTCGATGIVIRARQTLTIQEENV